MKQKMSYFSDICNNGFSGQNNCIFKSRNGMHFTLLKSDIICSFYTNLNIEKYAVVLAGKPIITDI
jgi:hypothetical protein